MAETIVLSARMQAVADMVKIGNRICDVGCDHGYVSIYLVQQKIAPKALALDINEGPLQRAERHVAGAGLSAYITLRISDGLDRYRPGEAQTLICAGMGGRLMQKILEKEPDKTESFGQMILQPQSELLAFRRFLRETGYSIVREDMVLEENKFYPVIEAVPDKKEQRNADFELSDRFGPKLLAARHPVLLKYLQKEWENSQKLLEVLKKAGSGSRVRKRYMELEEELGFLEKALKICGCDTQKEKACYGNNYN